MHQTIVIPIDLSHTERIDAMVEKAKLCATDDSELLFVTVIEEVPGYVAAQLPGGVFEETEQKAKAKLAEIAKGAGMAAATEVRHGHPATAIMAAAEEHKADLIVIASHRPGWQDFLLGSTAARVVRHAKCSVYVLR